MNDGTIFFLTSYCLKIFASLSNNEERKQYKHKKFEHFTDANLKNLIYFIVVMPFYCIILNKKNVPLLTKDFYTPEVFKVASFFTLFDKNFKNHAYIQSGIFKSHF